MATISTLLSTDDGNTSLGEMNTNFSNLNSAKVEGPASNTNNNIPQWDGANSKLLKDGKTAPSGNIVGDTDTQTLSSKTLTSPLFQGAVDGWILTNDSWSYASSTTITVPSGAASKYSIGDKIKITQTTVKYFYIVAIADTLLTVAGGSDYSVANATITLNYYSKTGTPQGFPTYFNLTAPTWTTSGTAFTNAPTTGNARFSMKGDTIFVDFYFTCNATSGGTGVFTATFTSGQIPTISSYYPGTAWNVNTGAVGACLFYVSGGTGKLQICKYDGTAIATNSQVFVCSSMGKIDN